MSTYYEEVKFVLSEPQEKALLLIYKNARYKQTKTKKIQKVTLDKLIEDLLVYQFDSHYVLTYIGVRLTQQILWKKQKLGNQYGLTNQSNYEG